MSIGDKISKYLSDRLTPPKKVRELALILLPWDEFEEKAYYFVKNELIDSGKVSEQVAEEIAIKAAAKAFRWIKDRIR